MTTTISVKCGLDEYVTRAKVGSYEILPDSAVGPVVLLRGVG